MLPAPALSGAAAFPQAARAGRFFTALAGGAAGGFSCVFWPRVARSAGGRGGSGLGAGAVVFGGGLGFGTVRGLALGFCSGGVPLPSAENLVLLRFGGSACGACGPAEEAAPELASSAGAAPF
ncbi:MAG: hypothetical protein GY772_28795 [bacterium]|nr:hypothetical protein [bacterium]